LENKTYGSELDDLEGPFQPNPFYNSLFIAPLLADVLQGFSKELHRYDEAAKVTVSLHATGKSHPGENEESNPSQEESGKLMMTDSKGNKKQKGRRKRQVFLPYFPLPSQLLQLDHKGRTRTSSLALSPSLGCNSSSAVDC